VLLRGRRPDPVTGLAASAAVLRALATRRAPAGRSMATCRRPGRRTRAGRRPGRPATGGSGMSDGLLWWASTWTVRAWTCAAPTCRHRGRHRSDPRRARRPPGAAARFPVSTTTTSTSWPCGTRRLVDVGADRLSGSAGSPGCWRPVPVGRRGVIRAVGYHERVHGRLDRWALDRIVGDDPCGPTPLRSPVGPQLGGCRPSAGRRRDGRRHRAGRRWRATVASSTGRWLAARLPRRASPDLARSDAAWPPTGSPA